MIRPRFKVLNINNNRSINFRGTPTLNPSNIELSKFCSFKDLQLCKKQIE
jgi:hypothetical protein